MDRPEKRYSSTEQFEAPTGTANPFRGLKPRTVRTLPAYVEHILQPEDRLRKRGAKRPAEP